MFRYPTVADLTPDILVDAYKILSSREFTKKNAAIMGKHFYIIQGVLQNEWLGEPDTFGVAGDSTALDDLFKTADFKKLEEECKQIAMIEKRFGGEKNFGAPDAEMDPATILMFVEMAVKIIQLIRERRKPK